MTDSLTTSGLLLTLYGMGTVFVFLVLLIFATRFMSWVALKIDVQQTSSIAAPAPRPESDATIDDSRLVAVITAAVRHYRQSNKNK